MRLIPGGSRRHSLLALAPATFWSPLSDPPAMELPANNPPVPARRALPGLSGLPALTKKLGTAVRTQRAEREYGMDALAKDLATYLPESQIAEVRRAYEYGARMHQGQARTSGEPYIYHPLAVADILAGMCMDATTLIAAVLHDVIEDTPASKEEVARLFGTDVATLVDGVSKMERVAGQSKAESQAENFRKMLLAMTTDLRVIIVKLADRLHNMRTLGPVTPEKRKRVARETMEIYVPIAQRLGIHRIKVELEDLCFEALYPWRFSTFQAAVETALGEERDIVRKVERQLKDALKAESIDAHVTGRTKSLYSLYEKMRRSGIRRLENVSDLLGFRVVTQSINECYVAVGIVHDLYKPLPGHFDDYIASPKQSGYQSLHTTCVGPSGQQVEVQIRTQDMHRVAEAGIAAHWQYKSTRKSKTVLKNWFSFRRHAAERPPQVRAREWLKDVLEQDGGLNAVEFMEHVKVDLAPEEIYVFTPKGEIRALPRGATPVDFAFAIHTDLGLHCVSARVDGKLESLGHALESGQKVEIISVPSARPKADWLLTVKTAKARSEIRRFLQSQQTDEAVRLGRRLLEIALRDLTLPATEYLDGPGLQGVLDTYHLADAEDLFASIGRGERLAMIVARSFLPGGAGAPPDLGPTATELGLQPESCPLPLPHRTAALPIQGIEGMVVNYARCCRPIPGDDIVGYLSKGRGIVIHREHCPQGQGGRTKPAERIPLVWAERVSGEYLCEITVQARNTRGLLAMVSGAISDADSMIDDVGMTQGSGSAENEPVSVLRFVIAIRDRRHLARVFRQIRKLAPVEKVWRVPPG